MRDNEISAVVTGGASGLGEAVVRAIVAGGGRVLILDMNENAGTQLAAELGGDNVVFAATDVTDPAAVTAALDRGAAVFGSPNALVNCAGIAIAAKTLGRDGPHSLADFSQVVDINLKGTFNTCRLVAARMQDNLCSPNGLVRPWSWRVWPYFCSGTPI